MSEVLLNTAIHLELLLESGKLTREEYIAVRAAQISFRALSQTHPERTLAYVKTAKEENN